MNKIAKNIKMLFFFKLDWSFWDKINIPIITLYDALRNNEIKYISHNKKLGKLYFNLMNRYNIVTDYAVGTIVQVFCYKNYDLKYLDDAKKYVVFDLGMNKGFSSMWFANKENVTNVIGYEINPNLFQYIEENREMNKELFEKIVVNNYGLSNKSYIMDLFILDNDDGVTTSDKEFFTKYWSDKRKKLARKEKVKVIESSREIKKYIQRYPNSNFILKIDVEGAEYQILPNLYRNHILEKFDIIFIEVHKGILTLEKYLENFKIVGLEKHSDDLVTFVALKYQ